jgi:hypothetical protein
MRAPRDSAGSLLTPRPYGTERLLDWQSVSNYEIHEGGEARHRPRMVSNPSRRGSNAHVLKCLDRFLDTRASPGIY